MSSSIHPLKVSQERIKTYTQRRNSHLVSAAGDAEQSDAPDPYAFEEGDEEFTFTEKKDKPGSEKDGSKKHKVGLATSRLEPEVVNAYWPISSNICSSEPL